MGSFFARGLARCSDGKERLLHHSRDSLFSHPKKRASAMCRSMHSRLRILLQKLQTGILSLSQPLADRLSKARTAEGVTLRDRSCSTRNKSPDPHRIDFSRYRRSVRSAIRSARRPDRQHPCRGRDSPEFRTGQQVSLGQPRKHLGGFVHRRAELFKKSRS